MEQAHRGLRLSAPGIGRSKSTGGFLLAPGDGRIARPAAAAGIRRERAGTRDTFGVLTRSAHGASSTRRKIRSAAPSAGRSVPSPARRVGAFCPYIVSRAIRIGVFTAATILVILTGTFNTVAYFFAKEVESAYSSMNKMIDCGQLEEAKAMLRDLPEHVRETLRIQEMTALLQKKSEKEHDRQADFTQQLRTAKLSLQATSQSLANDPWQSVLARAWIDLQLDRNSLTGFSTWHYRRRPQRTCQYGETVRGGE